MYRKTKGIILRKRKLGEGDEILKIYTPHWGKIEALAKGISKINSKRGGHLDLLMFSSFNFYINRKSQYFVREVSTINSFKNIRTNFNKIILGCYLSELIDKTTFCEEGNYSIFNLFKRSLMILNSTEKKTLTNLLYLFKLKLINLLGFKPKLNYCLVCRRKVDYRKKLFFNVYEGGVVCHYCQKSHQKNIYPVTYHKIYLLEKLIKLPLEKFFLISPKAIAEVNDIVDSFLETITEKELQSKNIIKKIKKEIKSCL